MRICFFGETSGRGRNACLALGHDAWSCDLLPTEVPGPHRKADMFKVMEEYWDIGIFHPTCTYMCVSGLHWNKRRPERERETERSLDEVRKIMSCHIPKWAIENPIGCISTRIRKPDQIIQPWQFGHPESKATCLWLHGLPLLIPTKVLPLPPSGRWMNQTPSGQNKLGPSADRWKIRSRTYLGIAQAMALQWTIPNITEEPI